jgi:hypothetical protein
MALANAVATAFMATAADTTAHAHNNFAHSPQLAGSTAFLI